MEKDACEGDACCCCCALNADALGWIFVLNRVVSYNGLSTVPTMAKYMAIVGKARSCQSEGQQGLMSRQYTPTITTLHQLLFNKPKYNF